MQTRSHTQSDTRRATLLEDAIPDRALDGLKFRANARKIGGVTVGVLLDGIIYARKSTGGNVVPTLSMNSKHNKGNGNNSIALHFGRYQDR